MEKLSNSFLGHIDRPKFYSTEFLDHLTYDLDEMPAKFNKFISYLNYFDTCLDSSMLRRYIFSCYSLCGNRFHVDILFDYFLVTPQNLINLAFEIKYLKRDFENKFPESEADLLFDSYADGCCYDLKLSFNFTVDHD